MWIEKYRPRRVDEILGQEELVKRIKELINRKTMPNLLFWGPKGVGKTSLVLALANAFYGESYEENLLFIESSNFVKRGKRWLKEDKRFILFYDEQKSAIDIFKKMIKEYAALPPLNADFRILYFNNADLLPENAQQALRRIMEKRNRTSRFIYSTTKPAGIITPIRSRCLNLYFKPLDKSDAMEILLKSIAEEEGVKLTEGGLKAIKRYAEGNAGVAISLMEAAAVSSTSVPSEPEPKVIDVDRVEEVVRHAFFQRKKAEELIDLAFEGRHKEVREGLEFLMEGERIQGEEILLEIHKALKRKMEEMKMKMKIEMKREEEISAKSARLILYESEADLKLCSSLNNMIHLEELLMRFKV